MTWRFDEHTAVTADGDALHATIDGTWSGYLGAHGGYVAATALRAMTIAIDAPDRPARSLNVHLLEPVDAGDLHLQPHVQRTGRSSSMATVRLRQRARAVAVASAAFASSRASIEHWAVAMPDVPPPQECSPLGGEPVPDASVSQYVEYRPAVEPLPFAGSSHATISVWMRLGERRPVDDFAATFLVDAAVPALYAALSDYVAMPTTDLTVHYAQRPHDLSEWALGVFRTRVAADGHALEDGELWSPDGTLLLSARQLRRIIVPATSRPGRPASSHAASERLT